MKLIRYTLKQMLLSLLLLLTLLVIPAFWVNQSIFTPPRRTLQDYHIQRLQQPEKFGLRIREHACVDGLAPCLLVEPSGKPSAAETAIRQQEQRGKALPPFGSTNATILLLHGRKGRKEDLLPVAERFVALGFRCILFDLPAHGESPLPDTAFGSTAFESRLPRMVLEEVRQRFGLPVEPTFLWGMSMGSAFALSAAKESPSTWRGMILLGSFDRLLNIALSQTPPYLQFVMAWETAVLHYWRQFHKQADINGIAPIEWAEKVTLPALVIHGEDDNYVPLALNKKLFEALASPDKQWITVPDANHRTLLSTSYPLYAKMGEWLLRHE